MIVSDFAGRSEKTDEIEPIIPTCRNCSPSLPLLRFYSPFSVFLHVNARTSTAIVSTLPERITIAAFYPHRERGSRTFLKFWWPPPAGPCQVYIHTSYWFSFRRSFRSCRVRLSLTRLHTTDPSPLVLLSSACVCLLTQVVCVHNGCVGSRQTRPVRMRKTHTHARARERENARGRKRERKERERERKKNERKMMCAYAPLASSSGQDRSTIKLRETFRRVKGSKSTDSKR